MIEQHIALIQGFDSIYMGVLAMGFFYGLTLCSFSCLPIIAPYLLTARKGFHGGFDITALFIGARVLTYSALGAAAGWLGQTLPGQLQSGLLYPIAGALVLAIGFAVMFRTQKSCLRPAAQPGGKTSAALHMMLLGAATGLMPCLPLTAVLLMAASSGSVLTGALLAFIFGAGSAASPLYYLGGATSWLGTRLRREIPRFAPALQRISGAILAIFGARLLLSWGLS